jgi:hypothetical protein
MKIFTRVLFLIVALCCWVIVGYGQSVSYSSTNTTGTGNATIIGSEFTSAGGLSRGSSVSYNAGSTFNSNGWTTASSKNANDFIQFSATIGATTLNLGSLEIRYDRSNTGPSSILIEANGTQIFSDNSVSTSGENQTINLISFTSLQNISNTTIVFKIFGFNASGGSGTFDIEDLPGGASDVGIILSASVATPVTLTKFQGFPVNNQAHLSFTTATEENNSHFLIQRSTDEGKTFETIGQVDGKGDSHSAVDYEFVDTKPAAGMNYYRLQQFDFDGTNEFFGPVAVRFRGEVADAPVIWPVPARDRLQIELPASDSDWLLEVFDLNGRRLLQQTTEEKGFNTFFDLTTLPAGSYFLRWNNGSQSGQERFLKV